MSRTRRAATMAIFAYLQYALAIVTGLFLVPLTLHTLGARTWGLWLASGEVLSYAAMMDLGILGVLPWMLAEADGRRDREELSTLMSQGVWLGACVGVIYATTAVVAWQLLSTKMFLTPADRDAVVRPLALFVFANAFAYPLGVYRAFIVGVQDVFFNGVLTFAQTLLGAVLTAVLLISGFGLYALVWASVIPTLLALGVALVRAAVIAPDLVWRFSWPQFRHVRVLLTNGIGGWLGALGWQMLAASNGIVITYMGHPEWVPIYVCTAKLAAMCMPLAWVLPDSGHVGLAQLHGEQQSGERVRLVVMMMQRLHLLLAGAMACALLAFNPAFVTRWVGAPLFGGVGLNVLLAAGVLVHSFIHGLVSSASIIGNRAKVGMLVLVNGALQTVVAIVLGHRVGLIGIAWAALFATLVTSLPGGIVLLRPTTGLTARGLFAELVLPWAKRALPFVALAALVGVFSQSLGVWRSAMAGAVIALGYVWRMRPLYGELPIDKRWLDWLVRLRVLPSPPARIPAAVGAAFEDTRPS